MNAGRLLLLAALAGFGASSVVAQTRIRLNAGGGLAGVSPADGFSETPLSFTPQAVPLALPVDLNAASNAAHVIAALRLDANAREALERNGFVAVPSPFDGGPLFAAGGLREGGVPLFITSDLLLHVYHQQFDAILKRIEEERFYPMLTSLSKVMMSAFAARAVSLPGILGEAAQRNAAYFAVGASLLDADCAVPDGLVGLVAAETARIEAHSGFESNLVFRYEEDYSQYVPRGHYTDSETLGRYFKAMMWYGRLGFLLKGGVPPGPHGPALVSPRDADIQTLQAVLIVDALDTLWRGALGAVWARIYAVTSFFVGESDDLTPLDYKRALIEEFGAELDLEELAREEALLRLRARLALFRGPAIYGGTGGCAIAPPITPEKLDAVLDKTKGMRLMGQRDVPDSRMFQRLVAPAVGRHTGESEPFTAALTPAGVFRCFPRGLDVMAVLGSDRALAILDRDGDTAYERYDRGLNDLRAETEAIPPERWMRTLYSGWLYALASLLGPCGRGYPAFMRSPAWQDKQLCAALASWTELRHNTILYAKQSYTAGVTDVRQPPVPPRADRGCVEPAPRFFSRLADLSRATRVGLGGMGVLSDRQATGLADVEAVLRRLCRIAIDEIEGRALSEADCGFIEGECVARLTGAVLGMVDKADLDVPAVVADVHTDQNTGQVLEEATGRWRLLVVAYRLTDGRVVLGAGPVYTCYEFKWPMSDRLTDERWNDALNRGTQPAEPDWVRSYAHPVRLPPPDGDRDGLPDEWETAMCGTLARIGARGEDADGDGLSNEEEFWAGTDPCDPASCVRITGVRRLAGTNTLTWRAGAGRRCRALWSDDLARWRLLAAPVRTQGATGGMDDAAGPEADRRFYRIQTVP